MAIPDETSIALLERNGDQAHGEDLVDQDGLEIESATHAPFVEPPSVRSATPDVHDDKDNLRTDHKGAMNPRLLVAVLFLLYLSEGIPAGLIGATLPILLKPALGFSKVGLFTICFYPFFLKLLWAPIVDSLWSSKFGRRRSWLFPTLFIQGIMLLAMALSSERTMDSIMQESNGSFAGLLALCFAIILLSATQGCAIDGWTVTEIPEQYHAAASAAHNIGFVAGEFASNSGFLFLQNAGYMSLPLFTGGTACLMLGLAVIVLLMRESSPQNVPSSPKGAYLSIFKLLMISPVRMLIAVHLVARLAFEVNDSATNLRLLDKAFTTSDIALFATLDLPFDILSSYFAVWLCKRHTAMEIWSSAFIGRLFAAVAALILVAMCPEDSVPTSQFVLNCINHALSTSTTTIMFTVFLKFHLQVADPVAGSVYMTLLATAQNLGGTLPRAILMYLIDVTTFTKCVPGTEGTEGIRNCKIVVDGYLVIGSCCIVVGSIIFFCYMKQEVLRLQHLPRAAWLIRSTGNS